MIETALPAAPPETASPPKPAIVRNAATTLGATAALLVLADWLFFNAAPFGLSVALFSLAVSIGAFGIQRGMASQRDVKLGAAIAVLGALPAAIEASALSFMIAVMGAGLAALAFSGGLQRSWQGLLRQSGRLFGIGPFQIIGDAFRAPRAIDAAKARSMSRSLGLTWVVPLGLSLIFLALFAQANPLISAFVGQWERALLGLFNPVRIIFWGIVLAVIWPMLNLRLNADTPAKANVRQTTLADYLMSDATILRALILFNGLFAVQTLMDAAYLTEGLTLPAGMTYARYAHSGAYPLIGTALLAAAFVLVALRKGGTAEQSPVLRRLLYLFIAQNIALVVSSIYRLKLYVDAYSMTHWRLAAFVWMALVLLGLALIIIRIADRRDNDWLIGRNLMALGLALYASCFVNTANLIGNYNIDHAQARSFSVDGHYLTGLGSQAIPAIDRLIDLANAAERTSTMPVANLVLCRNRLADRNLREVRKWRSWTVRGQIIRNHVEQRLVRSEARPVGEQHSMAWPLRNIENGRYAHDMNVAEIR